MNSNRTDTLTKKSDKYEYRQLTYEQLSVAEQALSTLRLFGKMTDKPGNFTDYRWMERMLYENSMATTEEKQC